MKQALRVKLKYGVYVEKSPAEVFSFLCDADRMTEWQSSMFEVKGKARLSDQGQLQRGTRVQDRRNVLGKELDSEWEVAEMEQNKRLVLRVTEGPAKPWETVYTLEEMNGGTYLSADGGGNLGQVPMSSSAAHAACQRMFEQDLRTLVDIIEK
jgi:uncharacterized protein YndB with AHSA1/START domain